MAGHGWPVFPAGEPKTIKFSFSFHLSLMAALRMLSTHPLFFPFSRSQQWVCHHRRRFLFPKKYQENSQPGSLHNSTSAIQKKKKTI
jgi:hypothetical protein